MPITPCSSQKKGKDGVIGNGRDPLLVELKSLASFFGDVNCRMQF